MASSAALVPVPWAIVACFRRNPDYPRCLHDDLDVGDSRGGHDVNMLASVGLSGMYARFHRSFGCRVRTGTDGGLGLVGRTHRPSDRVFRELFSWQSSTVVQS